MGGLFAALGDVSWLSHGQVEDALYRVAQGRGVLRMERGADYFIGVQHRHGEAAVGECSPDVVAAIHGVIEDPDAGALHAGYRGEQAFPTIAKWRANPGGFLADVALIIWDRRARRLEASRGWSTHRPLFWTEHRGAILLASEIRVLLRLCGRAWIPDPNVMEAFLAGQAQPADASGCVGIGLVRAGSRLRFVVSEAGGVGVPRVITMGLPGTVVRSGAGGNSPSPGAIADLLIAIDREIEVTGEPLYHLSSGADSSSLVLAALASRRQRGSEAQVTCYTRSFPGTLSDESAKVEQFCKGRAISSIVECQDPAAIDAVWAECAPSLDFLTGPTIYGALSSARRAIAQGRSQVVSGIGGDELFGCYEHLCAEDGWRQLWQHRRALGTWFGDNRLTGPIRAILSVYLSRWRHRAELEQSAGSSQRALRWRLQVWVGARGKLAAEQIHERSGVAIEAPFLRGSVVAAVAPLGQLARLGDGRTKGFLEEVRSTLAGDLSLPEPAKVNLNFAIPSALRLSGRATSVGEVDSRSAMLGAWRASIARVAQ